MIGRGLPRAPRRRLIGMGMFSFVSFWLLIALGVWQVHRWHHKDRVQRRIDAAQLAPPVPLPSHPTPYQKVAIAGHWIAGRAAFFGDQVRNSVAGPVRGAQLVMPFRRDNGDVVMVDLGWVPGTAPKPVPVPAGPTQVSGYVQAAQKPGLFSAQDNVAGRIFYTLDPRRIGAGLGLNRVADFTLIVVGPKPLAGGPVPAPRLPHPPNNSEQYALTWFGLAMVVVFEFFFYARKQLGESS
ncbi:SURF1 family protein [Acidiphilium iwatense]|uniref:SURF1-like protein n=1 Tax=Acidiphilium iwatense TaxID=768198 RepID=A0ABS9E076_9PROT|nr:SURF1 family protein [Acidiphilium iwatense]MCF3947425.1 SURF1 family protein [Acidiphilium iwatense]